MNDIEAKIGIAMAALLAVAEARGGEAPLMLPEIVVTATPADLGYKADIATVTKIDTPIFDLPFSIEVVPREVLDDQQVIRLEDALKNVSGVYQAFNNGFGEPDYGLRGFRQFFVFEDGFRVPGVPGPGFQETAHLERVEVLKGPASALYGRIEPGGIIHQVTKRPRATASYTPQEGPSSGSVSGPGSSPRTHGRATTPGPSSFPAMCGWISWPVMNGPSGVPGSPPRSTSRRMADCLAFAYSGI